MPLVRLEPGDVAAGGLQQQRQRITPQPSSMGGPARGQLSGLADRAMSSVACAGVRKEAGRVGAGRRQAGVVMGRRSPSGRPAGGAEHAGMPRGQAAAGIVGNRVVGSPRRPAAPGACLRRAAMSRCGGPRHAGRWRGQLVRTLHHHGRFALVGVDEAHAGVRAAWAASPAEASHDAAWPPAGWVDHGGAAVGGDGARASGCRPGGPASALGRAGGRAAPAATDTASQPARPSQCQAQAAPATRSYRCRPAPARRPTARPAPSRHRESSVSSGRPGSPAGAEAMNAMRSQPAIQGCAYALNAAASRAAELALNQPLRHVAPAGQAASHSSFSGGSGPERRHHGRITAPKCG